MTSDPDNNVWDLVSSQAIVVDDGRLRQGTIVNRATHERSATYRFTPNSMKGVKVVPWVLPMASMVVRMQHITIDGERWERYAQVWIDHMDPALR